MLGGRKYVHFLPNEADDYIKYAIDGADRMDMMINDSNLNIPVLKIKKLNSII